MSEAYLKVNIMAEDDGFRRISFPTYNENTKAEVWVKNNQLIYDVPDKEEIRAELMYAIRYVRNQMNDSERLDIFGYDSLHDILLNYDGSSIIRKVEKFQSYPASGKIYTKKRGGEDVLCMVLGVEKDWVCYTEKSRETHGTTVDAFLECWEYTGECKEKEVDAIYDALK